MKGNRRLVRPTVLTWVACAAAAGTLLGTAAFLLGCYPSLPDILPVRFNRSSRPIGWQYKTILRVMSPAIVQTSLALVLGSVTALLLSRRHARGDELAPDIAAASVAAEAIALVAFVWIAFQAYVAASLVAMWQRGRGGLGDLYPWLTFGGIALSIAVAYRAHAHLGRPAPREYVAEHWRFGHLYKNPADPALFVPTRDGVRWTLNFGRPVAAALLGVVLLTGIVLPTVILGLLLRL